MDDYNARRLEREEGLKQGREEGLAEGEANAKRQFALKLLKDGISIEKIEEYTGLSVTEIQKLKLIK